MLFSDGDIEYLVHDQQILVFRNITVIVMIN